MYANAFNWYSPQIYYTLQVRITELFRVSGEILCQGRDAPASARLQTPLPKGRAIPVASANGGPAANAIGRPTKQQQQDAIQKQTTPTPPVSVKELFNSSSCVEPPFTCPHPRIQFYLYTRYYLNNNNNNRYRL